MAAETPIPPVHTSVPGRPVPEEGDDYRRHPRRRPGPDKPPNETEKGKDKPRETPRPPKDEDPDHIDEYA